MNVEDNSCIIDLAALQNRDIGAYSALFNHYYTGLCGFAERIIGNSQAEDVVGEVFSKLWEGKLVFESELHLKSFLYRSVKNGCLNVIKMAGRADDRNHFFYSERGDCEDSFLREVTRAEVLRELHLAVNELPPQAGKIIRLSFLEGMSNQEVADCLGLSIQTVKNQKLRGLGILRGKISKDAFMILVLLPYIDLLESLKDS